MCVCVCMHCVKWIWNSIENSYSFNLILIFMLSVKCESCVSVSYRMENAISRMQFYSLGCLVNSSILGNAKKNVSRPSFLCRLAAVSKNWQLFLLFIFQKCFFMQVTQATMHPALYPQRWLTKSTKFLQVCKLNSLNRAGHFRYFLFFFTNKKWFCFIFYQVDNIFLHQSYLKCPLPVKLTW